MTLRLLFASQARKWPHGQNFFLKLRRIHFDVEHGAVAVLGEGDVADDLFVIRRTNECNGLAAAGK